MFKWYIPFDPEATKEIVPPAILAFLESIDFEDAIRKAISLGGDADTLAAITGSIAEAFYRGVPADIFDEVKKRVPVKLWNVIEEFSRHFAIYARSTECTQGNERKQTKRG